MPTGRGSGLDPGRGRLCRDPAPARRAQAVPLPPVRGRALALTRRARPRAAGVSPAGLRGLRAVPEARPVASAQPPHAPAAIFSDALLGAFTAARSALAVPAPRIGILPARTCPPPHTLVTPTKTTSPPLEPPTPATTTTPPQPGGRDRRCRSGPPHPIHRRLERRPIRPLISHNPTIATTSTGNPRISVQSPYLVEVRRMVVRCDGCLARRGVL